MPIEYTQGLDDGRGRYPLHIAGKVPQVVTDRLDADANMVLGNIFSENLADILQTDRAKQIKKGFEQRKIVEPICATCGFIID